MVGAGLSERPGQELISSETTTYAGVPASVVDRLFDAPTSSGTGRARSLDRTLITEDGLLVEMVARAVVDADESALPEVFASLRLGSPRSSAGRSRWSLRGDSLLAVHRVARGLDADR